MSRELADAIGFGFIFIVGLVVFFLSFTVDSRNGYFALGNDRQVVKVIGTIICIVGIIGAMTQWFIYAYAQPSHILQDSTQDSTLTQKSIGNKNDSKM